MTHSLSISVKHFATQDLIAYCHDDWVLALLSENAHGSLKHFDCHRWLKENVAKRMIFSHLYGSFFHSSNLKILDIGGGVTGLLYDLSKRHDYTLVDLLSHDTARHAVPFLSSLGVTHVHEDWHLSENITNFYDVLIANDIFPNVDQRLDAFLGENIPRAKKVMILLTYYNDERYYQVKRVDADETMFIKPWSGLNLMELLESKLKIKLSGPDREGFLHPEKSMYPNGRNVSLLQIENCT